MGVQQSNPSTLTGVCFLPTCSVAWWANRGEAESAGGLPIDVSILTPKCESCTKGFEVLHGGEPKKNGGGDGEVSYWSGPKSSYRKEDDILLGN